MKIFSLLLTLFAVHIADAQTLLVERQDVIVENCSGCAKVPFADYVIDGALRLSRDFGVKDGVRAAVYDYDNNLTHIIRFQTALAPIRQTIQIEKSFLSSGGRGGVSNVVKSGGTPPGVHVIYSNEYGKHELNQTIDASKYGYRETILTPTQGFEDWKSDIIMTRLMRLRGLEGSKNSHSVARKILFHSTPEEGMIGYHESGGCIRLKNREMIEFFDMIPEGTLVNIVHQKVPQKRRVSNDRRIFIDESKIPDLRRIR